MTAEHPHRRHLPPTRPSLTHKREVCGFELYVTVSFFEADGNDTAARIAPAEVFIIIAKHGSEISGLMDGVAVLLSVALQYGVPWSALREKFAGAKFGSTDQLNSSLLDGLMKMIDHCIAQRSSDVGHDEGGAAGAPVPAPKPPNLPKCPKMQHFLKEAADADTERRERALVRAVLIGGGNPDPTELQIDAAMKAAQQAAQTQP